MYKCSLCIYSINYFDCQLMVKNFFKERINGEKMNIMHKIILVGIFFIVFGTQECSAAGKNLIGNSGFEETGEKGKIPCWNIRKKVNSEVCLSENAHSGKKSLTIKNNAFLSNRKSLNVGVYTNEFRSPPYRSTVTVSGWLKAENIKKGKGSYHKLRLTLYALDENKGALTHKEIACIDGSFDWVEFSGSMIIPKGTDLLKVGCWLTNATGTAWVDDLKVVVTKLPPSAKEMLSGEFNVEVPVIMPNPWQTKRTNRFFAFNKICINSDGVDERIKNAAEQYFHVSNQTDKNNCLELFFSKTFSADSQKIAKDNFPEISLESLGDEGYFILAEEDAENPKIYLIANTDKGLFNALQTFRQTVEKSKDFSRVSLIQVVDKPQLSLRGVVLGQWLKSCNQLEAIERCAKLKINFVYIGGTTLNNKLGGNPNYGTNWRKPFSNNELKILKDTIEACHKNFIKPAITFSPRGNPPNCYSSDEDINIIIEKSFVLYNLGARIFGLNFDDMSNSGSEGFGSEQDRVKFKNNVGEAHRFFVREVYEGLKKKTGKNDFDFLFLPMAYGRFKNMNEKDKSYLSTVSSLPKNIGFISCIGGDDVINTTYNKHIKRKPIIWDNYFCGWGRIGGAPSFIPPFEGDTRLSDNNISGYMLLPQMKIYEDASLISWMTAADYMWAPEMYNYQDSFKRAVLKAVRNKKNIPKLANYIDTIEKISKLSLPLKDKKTRLKYVRDNIKFLKKSKADLKNILSVNLYNSEILTIDKTLQKLELVEKDLINRPFPLKVDILKEELKIDGKLDEDAWKNCKALGDFINIKTLKPAETQTLTKVMYDDKHLYIGIVCKEQNVSGIAAKYTKKDSQVFADDSIELFFDTEQTMEKYYHIVVNTLGTVYDAVTQNKNWNGSYSIGTSVGENSWTLEMSIPVEQFVIEKIKPGKRWNFNVCREKHSLPKEFSSYALLIFKGFHYPTRFWTMEFKEGKDNE
jgi:beta-N-acetylglucosaminidase-like protein/cellulose/xylan binding protein with CBM9 domain/glycosyl hydrolase family 20